MAEILVSNFCGPLLLIGGLFHCLRGITTTPNGWRRLERSALALSSGVQPDVSTPPDFRLFPLLGACFFLLPPVSCAGGFSLAVARTCIVIPVVFPL